MRMFWFFACFWRAWPQTTQVSRVLRLFLKRFLTLVLLQAVSDCSGRSQGLPTNRGPPTSARLSYPLASDFNLLILLYYEWVNMEAGL